MNDTRDSTATGNNPYCPSTIHVCQDDKGDYTQQGERTATWAKLHECLQATVAELSRGGVVRVAVLEATLEETLKIDSNNIVIEGTTRGTGAVGNFEGEGFGGTKIEATHTDASISISSSDKLYGELRDLYLYGSSTESPPVAIAVKHCDQYQFHRLFVQNFDVGVHFYGRSNAYNIIQSIFIQNDTWHVKHQGTNKPQFYASKFLNNPGNGVLIQDVEKAAFDQCDFHANAGRSLVFDGASNALVDQCQFDQRKDETIGDIGIDVTADSRNVHVSDSQFQDWDKDGAVGVRLSGDRNQISGCTFDTVDTAIAVAGVENTITDCTFRNCGTAVLDTGTRTLVNRRGENAGDPNSRGDWQGHADYAYLHNASVYDILNDCWYKPTANGDWTQIHA
jgi:hypothetical protein